MKKLILMLAAAYLPSALAWAPVIQCRADRTEVDYQVTGFDAHYVFQLVIRPEGVVKYLKDSGAVLGHRVNAQDEIVIPLRINGKAFGHEYIGEDDAFQGDGRVYYVKPAGRDLVVESFRTYQPTGGIYVQRDESKVEWVFRGCE